MASGGERPGLVRRALAGHAALGLLASGLLYIIALTGTLAVIHDRWTRWEQPAVPEVTTLSPALAQAAIAAAVARSPGKPPGFAMVQFPTDDLPHAVVSTDAGAWSIDAAGRLGQPVAGGWTTFVVALHETLLLPASWGIAVVGALGVALAALALTGVLAHPRIVRDAFRLRWRQGPHIARVDWHNRLGVWTLPFTLALALTGAVLGLGAVGFAVLANAYDGGDVQRAYAPLFGGQAAGNATPAPPADVVAALAALHREAPAARATFLTVQAPATRGQAIQILAVPPRRLIYGESYRFDARGRLLGHDGLSDGAIGQQAIASLYGLHFGNVGGLAMELAYLLFGTALCVTIGVGPSIWLHKRARRGLPSARLAAGWNAVVWGVPLLLILAAWLPMGGATNARLPLVFWGGLAGLLIVAVVTPGLVTASRGRTLVFGSLAMTGAAHLLLVGTGSANGVAIDVVACVGSVVVLGVTRAISRDAALFAEEASDRPSVVRA